MNSIYRMLIFPAIARKVILRGKAWHTIVSLGVVTGSASVFAWLVVSNGCRFAGLVIPALDQRVFQGPLWVTTLALVAAWMLIVFWAATRRSAKLHSPIDIDSEAQCLALPFVLLLAGALVAHAEASMISSVFFPQLSNVVLAVFYANLVAISVMMATTEGAPEPAGDNSSRRMAKRYRARLLAAKRAGGVPQLTVLCVVLFGAAFLGHRDPLLLLPAWVPVVRCLVAAAGVVVLWAAVSCMCGGYRRKRLNDPLGMKIAVLVVGECLASFLAVLSIACVARDILTGVPDDILRDASDVTYLVPAMLVTALAALNAFIAVGSLFVTAPSCKSHVGLDEERDSMADPSRQAAAQSSWIDAGFESALSARLPRFRTWIPSLWRLLVLKSTHSEQMLALDAGVSLGIGALGFVLLALAIVAHGVTVRAIGKPALVRFMGIGSGYVDFLLGSASALAYIVLIAGAVWLALRIARANTTAWDVVPSLGYALLPLTATMLILSILAVRIPAREVAQAIFPCALAWGLGYLVLDLGAHVIPRKRLAQGISGLVLGVLLTHAAAGWLIQQAHLSAVRWMRVPLIEVRNSITDEFPPSMSDEARSASSRLANVDLADVRAADFIDQLTYTRMVATRFYKDQGWSVELSPVRIRAEVTSNAGWMRRLYPVMSRVTRSAKSPDDAARMVLRWLESTLADVKPLTWPLGEKFDQDPIATLTCRRGNEVDAAILMIAAMRASGVAARFKSPYPDELAAGSYVLAEYYDGTDWKPCYPRLGPVSKTIANAEDLAKFSQWASQTSMKSKLTLYVLIDGIWHPYCVGGRGTPGTCTQVLPPGTYLVSYNVGTICQMKKIVIRPSG